MKGVFMYPQSRTIRGLNIATAILSGIFILFGLFALAICCMFNAALSDPATANQIANQLLSSQSSGSVAFDGNSAYSYSYTYSGMTGEDALAIVMASGPMLVGLSVGYLIFRIVALVASILALRNYNNPAKLGGAFGWAIVAAVLQVFAGMMISAILFIISAVFIGKLRSAWKAGAFDNAADSQDGTPQPPVA